VKWELERLFDGKQCQKYLHQKLLKSAIFFQVTIDNVGVAFDVFLFISTHISSVLFSPGSAEADIGWREILNIFQTYFEHIEILVIWWPVVPKIIELKIIIIGYPFFKWQSKMFGMFFSGTVYNLGYYETLIGQKSTTLNDLIVFLSGYHRSENWTFLRLVHKRLLLVFRSYCRVKEWRQKVSSGNAINDIRCCCGRWRSV